MPIDVGRVRERLEQVLAEDVEPAPDDLGEVARAVLTRRAELLALTSRFPTPFYAYDPRGFRAALDSFRAAFDAHVPRHAAHYAVKSNHHPDVVREAVGAGYGLDVSSGRELGQALALPVAQILFSGPGKSDDDLALAASRAERVVVQLDSERELGRLSAVASRLGVTVRAGLRFWTGSHGDWSKFGVPLGEVRRLWNVAAELPGVRLEGLQSHLSWNRSAEPYVRVLEALGAELAGWSEAERARLRFVDVGGGYRPHRLEGSLPDERPLGAVLKALDLPQGSAAPYHVKPSVPVEDYARAIGIAARAHVPPGVDVFTEPGRVVSTHAMHLVVRVVDKKAPGLVIVDGGTHMVGWEKYQAMYCPVVNLTRPASSELEVRLGGSLCDSEDTLGDRVFAEALEEGDVLVVPFQGAYSWSTAQSFIRDIPPVHRLEP